MTPGLVEFLVGLYLVGTSFDIVKNFDAPAYTKQVNLFRLLFGLVLLFLAFSQEVRII